MKKLISGVLAISILLSFNITSILASNESTNSNNTAQTAEPNIYKSFKDSHSKTPMGNEDIIVDIYSNKDNNIKTNFKDNQSCVYSDKDSTAKFTVNVSESGLYYIKTKYMAQYERGSVIQREILVNDVLQYNEAKYIEFSRLYTNDKPSQDNLGNDIVPSQIEAEKWQEAFIKDSFGYASAPLLFYFTEGENTIEFKYVSEPLAITELSLIAPQTNSSYEQIKGEYAKEGYQPANMPPIYLQGEDAAYKSDPTLYPITDNSTSQTVPYEKNKQRLNSIGGYRWQNPGQFLTWDVNIEKSGLYKIAVKYRQNIVADTKSTRIIYIDDQIVFGEMANTTFSHSRKWQQKTVGNDSEDFQIYLSEGHHTIKMEVILGETSEQIQKVEQILKQLNKIYTTILMITGSTPDQMRDYNLDLLVSDEIAQMKALADELQGISDWYYNYSKKRGANTAVLDTMIRSLKKMAADHEKIPKEFASFKTNIGSLASWIVSAKQQPLEIDYLTLVSDDTALPKPTAGFWKQLSYEFTRFMSSFFNDYNSLGISSDTKKESIDVWIPTGRDQAQVLRKLIDNTLSPNIDFTVNLKLVSGGVVLPATVAGIGPDIALNMGDGEPVNYAIRNAAYDISRFEDFDTISKRFLAERMVPLSFGGKTYALPETQSFNVMFYREDILNDLGIKIPQTWDELNKIIPMLMKNNMNFAMPVSTAAAPAAGINSFFTLLLQKGGKIYEKNGAKTAIDSEQGLESFREWTNLYSNFALPLSYDFQNRFRTGEYPLIIADFGNFNSLVVSAPEIKGLWGFTAIPGTKRADGTIDRSVPTGGMCSMMMSASKNPEKAWEFLKWWSSAEAQTQYGKEMESLLGASARYATANIEAFKNTPWTNEQFEVLDGQLQWAKGIEQVPGGYFISRHLDNAFRKVINEQSDQRETLYDYSYIINQELTSKRKEFGLETE